MSLASGTRLGPYEIVAPLGAGGMGEVYRAHDSRLGREVAVKVLPASFAVDGERLRRFEQEARATGALNHPNILGVYDIGTHEGSPYVVSELLDGETLRTRIGDSPLPERKAIDYAAQIAKGLAAAHDKGIVHRDLKPDNLFVTRDGRVKILDFGLAKIAEAPAVDSETGLATAGPQTGAGTVLGTIGYMSPEQVRGHKVDHRSDIFSFGVVLYEMLTGRRAFQGDSAVETMNAILKEDPPLTADSGSAIRPPLDRIVLHCLEKSPDERFQSARDIAFDIETLSGTSSQAALQSPPVRRQWLRPALAGLAALVGGAALFVAGRSTATAPASPVVRAADVQARQRDHRPLCTRRADDRVCGELGRRAAGAVLHATGQPRVTDHRPGGRPPGRLESGRNGGAAAQARRKQGAGAHAHRRRRPARDSRARAGGGLGSRWRFAGGRAHGGRARSD